MEHARLVKEGVTAPVVGETDLLANVLGWTGQVTAASDLLGLLATFAARSASFTWTGLALIANTELKLRVGRFRAALADACGAEEQLAVGNLVLMRTYAAVLHASCEAHLGNYAVARCILDEPLAIVESVGLTTIAYMGRTVAGCIESWDNKLDAAIEHLEIARATMRADDCRIMMGVPWAPELVECYLRNGRQADAQRLVAELVDDGVRTQGPPAPAVLARCEALTASATPVRSSSMRSSFTETPRSGSSRRAPSSATASGSAGSGRPHARSICSSEHPRPSTASGREPGRPRRCRARGVRQAAGASGRPASCADAPGAAGRGGRDPGIVERRNRHGAVSEPEDRRLPPHQRIPKARCRLTHGTRGQGPRAHVNGRSVAADRVHPQAGVDSRTWCFFRCDRDPAG